ncbi:MAG TPA: hypothetical protein VFA20_27740 [Myxococcaceae bacterium]|nr:hypothetical protein [Myxococcaceae bacterium]
MSALTLPVNEMSSFDLPPVCLITGERTGVSFRKVKFAWYPRWIPALIFVPFGGLLLAAIVAMILTKKAAGELPFTDAGWSKWRLAKIMVGLDVLWVIFAMFAGIGLLAAAEGSAGGTAAGVLALASMVAVPVVIYFLFQRKKMITPTRITDTELTINVPNEEAAMAIRQHLTGGRVVQAQPMAVRAR